jgi:subtilisin family serine protease
MKRIFSLLLTLCFIFFVNPVNASEEEYEWALSSMNVEKARNLGFTGNGVKVAIIDSGIDYNHSEFSEKFANGKIKGINIATGGTNPEDFYENYEIDHDGNYILTEAIEPNACYPDGSSGGDKIKTFHGTFVAGSLAGQNLGVAPGVELYVAKTPLDRTSLAKAINWAVQQDVDIISISRAYKNDPLGIGWADYIFDDINGHNKVEEAINYAVTKGVLVVGSPGNISSFDEKGENPSNDNILYPGKFPTVVSVGAIQKTNNNLFTRSTGWVEGDVVSNNECVTYYSASATGPDIEVVAPGSNVKVALPSVYAGEDDNYKYTKNGGTSTAVPYVAGILALLKEQYPEDTPQMLRAKLRHFASKNKLVAGYTKDEKDWEYGYGLVQALPEEPIDLTKRTDISTTADTMFYFKHQVPAYEIPSEDSRFVVIPEGYYKATEAWKKIGKNHQNLRYDNYEWYKISTTDGQRWVKAEPIQRLDTIQWVNRAKDTPVYDAPIQSSASTPYPSTDTRWMYFGYDYNEKENRFNWYGWYQDGKFKWFKNDYSLFEPKNPSAANGFTDGVISNWNDYIGSPEVEEMKNNVRNNTKDWYAANFEEDILFSEAEYDEIMKKYSVLYRYRYMIKLDGRIDFIFSNEKLYKDTNTTPHTLKAEHNANFVRVRSTPFTDYSYHPETVSKLNLNSGDEFYSNTDMNWLPSKMVNIISTKFYDSPNGKVLYDITPQNLTITNRTGDWYEVNKAGWIKLTENELFIGSLDTTKTTLTMNNTHGLFTNINNAQPYAEKGKITYVSNRRLIGTDWHYIKTAQGNFFWVEANAQSFVGNFKVTINERVMVYNEKGSGPTGGYLENQTLTAYERDGNWFKVNTWLGQKWINPTNPVVNQN